MTWTSTCKTPYLVQPCPSGAITCLHSLIKLHRRHHPQHISIFVSGATASSSLLCFCLRLCFNMNNSPTFSKTLQIFLYRNLEWCFLCPGIMNLPARYASGYLRNEELITLSPALSPQGRGGKSYPVAGLRGIVYRIELSVVLSIILRSCIIVALAASNPEQIPHHPSPQGRGGK